MDDPGKLVVGNVYFTIDFVDEALKLPCLESYVYLGRGLLPGSTADDHFFQTVESFFSKGRWNELSASVRETLNGNAVIICASKNLGLVSDAGELVEEIEDWSLRSSRGAGS